MHVKKDRGGEVTENGLTASISSANGLKSRDILTGMRQGGEAVGEILGALKFVCPCNLNFIYFLPFSEQIEEDEGTTKRASARC